MSRRPLLLLGTLVLALVEAHPIASAQELPEPVVLRKLRLEGAGSCAAAACHNGPGAGVQGREYALALERDIAGPHQRVKDRHAQAYDVLFEPLARKIELALHPSAEPRPEADAFCLRCHVHPGFDSHPVRLRDGVAQFRVEDGVSCETCHGAAERWLAPHFRGGWSSLSAADRLALGQADSRSLPGRIRLCVDCHVGAAGMDVNHDLIAAGHPRLSFEFASYHFLLHKHWDYAKDRDPAADPRGRRDFEARAWLLGQLISARAALALLADRAAPAGDDAARPWPEFAEYDCAACHHDLRKSQAASDKLGTLPPSRWYTALLPDAFAGLDASFDAPMRDALANVHTAMQAHRPDRRQVAERARRAVVLLDRRIADVQETYAPVNINTLLRQIARNAGDRSAHNSDETAQRCLAIAALRRARNELGLPRPPLRDVLQLPPLRDRSTPFSPRSLRVILDSLDRNEPW